MPNRHRLPLAACAAALILAAPVAAARTGHRHATAPLPERSAVTIHHGVADARRATFAEGGAPWIGDGYAPAGYWESNYGREDDAAIFAQRYGCVRPIWNAKSNRYIAACN